MNVEGSEMVILWFSFLEVKEEFMNFVYQNAACCGNHSECYLLVAVKNNCPSLLLDGHSLFVSTMSSVLPLKGGYS